MLVVVGHSLSLATLQGEKLLSELSLMPPLKAIAQKVHACVADAEGSLSSLTAAIRPAPAGDRTVDVHQSVERVCKILEGRFKATAHSVRRDLRATAPTVAASAEELDAMLSNLLLFACQECPRGDTIHISSSDLPSSVQLRLRLRTSAQHLPEDELSAVLDSLSRTDPARRPSLGPVISRHIVENAGGALEADAGEENETVYTLRLPKPRDSAGSRGSP
jgi:signal transduction histidine kinase